MADYLKKFATQAEYDAYIQAGYPKPNVSYIVDNDEIIFTNYQDAPAGPEYILESSKIADFTGTTFNKYSQYVTDAYIPEGVTTIGANAFSDCEGLTSVRIPNSVTTIGYKAFSRCEHLTSIDIPSGVTTIGNGVFQNCIRLQTVNGFGDTLISVLPGGASNTYGIFNSTNIENIQLPSTLTEIGQNTFSQCEHLTSIDIPSGVTTIGNYAFQNCPTMTSVTVRATTPPTLGNNAFDNTNDTFIIYVPAESVEAYKAASGWSDYASRIQAITE